MEDSNWGDAYPSWTVETHKKMKKMKNTKTTTVSVNGQFYVWLLNPCGQKIPNPLIPILSHIPK
jgi:hypothetical protein